MEMNLMSKTLSRWDSLHKTLLYLVDMRNHATIVHDVQQILLLQIAFAIISITVALNVGGNDINVLHCLLGMNLQLYSVELNQWPSQLCWDDSDTNTTSLHFRTLVFVVDSSWILRIASFGFNWQAKLYRCQVNMGKCEGFRDKKII
jgi:hypothetical protein